MSFLYDPRRTTELRKEQAIAHFLDNARPDFDYYVLLLGASLLAAGAIFTDSIPTLIASMLVAPLAFPILALGLGVAAANKRLIARALGMLLFSCAIALTMAFIAATVFNKDRVSNILVSFNGNDHIAVAVAVISGFIAAFGITKPKIAAAMSGVAIAVSLMPPLVATGVSLVPGGSTLQGAPRLFLLNVVGIMLASALVFKCTGLAGAYNATAKKPSASLK